MNQGSPNSQSPVQARTGDERPPSPPTKTRSLPNLVNDLCSKAANLRQSGDLPAAEAAYREAISICEGSPVAVAPEYGFRLFSLLADLREAMGEGEEAIVHYQTSLAFANICEPAATLQRATAAVHNNFGRLLLHQENSFAAVEQFRLGVALIEDTDISAGPRDAIGVMLRPMLYENLGRTLIQTGNPKAARPILAESLRLHRSALSGDGDAMHEPASRRVLAELALVMEHLGDRPAAEACRQKSVRPTS